MILVDLNQVMISNLMMQIQRASEVDEDLIRHMVLNSLRMYNVKFKEEYGELVICTDDKNYWRRQIFPYYKYGRKKDREASDLDWNLIFETLNKVRDEIKENLPYKVIQIEHAEADDVISTLCHKYGVYLNAAEQEKILILSSDKDFTLHANRGTQLTVDLDATTLTLPVLGGREALVKAITPQPESVEASLVEPAATEASSGN